MAIAETVTVDLGSRSYDIVIGDGVLDRAGMSLAEVLGQRRCLIISDENVAPLYMDHLRKSLEAAGHSVVAQESVTPGETSKSLASYSSVVETLLAAKVERKDLVIALGGGVVGDLAGFVASSLLRGVDFVQIPTTLLAQVDSSVGGKTGLNTTSGKNLVGAFYQPKMVLMDLATLDTLPRRELLAGYAEVVKYGAIDDRAFFDWLVQNGPALLDGDMTLRAQATAHCCRAKARIVAEDEREAGKRALLNLGHTFGHALEAVAGYDGSLLHGEAVALGMVQALDLTARLNSTAPNDRDAMIAHFKDVGLGWSPKELSNRYGGDLTADRLLALMSHDKKVESGKLVFIHGALGQAAIDRTVPTEAVHATLTASLDGYDQ